MFAGLSERPVSLFWLVWVLATASEQLVLCNSSIAPTNRTQLFLCSNRDTNELAWCGVIRSGIEDESDCRAWESGRTRTKLGSIYTGTLTRGDRSLVRCVALGGAAVALVVAHGIRDFSAVSAILNDLGCIEGRGRGGGRHLLRTIFEFR